MCVQLLSLFDTRLRMYKVLTAVGSTCRKVTEINLKVRTMPVYGVLKYRS